MLWRYTSRFLLIAGGGERSECVAPWPRELLWSMIAGGLRWCLVLNTASQESIRREKAEDVRDLYSPNRVKTSPQSKVAQFQWVKSRVFRMWTVVCAGSVYFCVFEMKPYVCRLMPGRLNSAIRHTVCHQLNDSRSSLSDRLPDWSSDGSVAQSCCSGAPSSSVV